MTIETVSRRILTVPDTLWARVVALQIAETTRLQKAVSQAEIARRALTIGLKAMEQDSNLDAT